MFTFLRRSKSRKPLSRRRRLSLESLEQRAMLANFTWTLGADGSFGNAAAWTDNADPNRHAVPGAGDNATIPLNFRVTTAGRSVNSISGVVQVTSGVLSLGNASVSSALFGLQLDAGASLRTSGGETAIFGSEISGTLETVGLGTTRFERGLNNLKPGASLIGNGKFLMNGDVFGAPTVALLTNITAPTHFLLKNGLIGGSGDLTINGTTFDWGEGGSGAAIAGSGTVFVTGGTLNIGGGDVSLSQRTIVNTGSIIVSATGTVTMSDNAVIDNRSTGVIDVQTDVDFAFGPAQSIINAGLFKKSAGVLTTAINVSFFNTGTLDVQTGSVFLRGGVTSNAVIKTANGTAIDLTQGVTNTFEGTVTFQGNGNVLTGSGVVSIGGTGATFSVPPTTTFSWGGVISVPVNKTLNFNGNVNLTSDSNSMFLIGGGQFVLNGNAVHSGAGSLFIGGDVSNTVPSTLTIPATRTYSFSTNSGIRAGGGSGIVVNNGTLRKSNGTGTSSVEVEVRNTGTLQASKGTLAFRNTSSMNGTVNAAAGSVVSIADSTFGSLFTQTGTLTGSGSGTLLLGGGTLAVSASGASVNIPASMSFVWSGGVINVPASVSATINGNVTQTSNDNVVVNGGGTLTFNGNVTQSGSGSMRIDGGAATASTINIPVGKSFLLAGNSGLIQGFSGGGVVNNNGTIRKTAGAGTSLISTVLSKAANLTVDTGVLTLSPAAGVVQGGTFNVAAGAVLNLTNGINTTTTMSGIFTGSGAGEVRMPGGIVMAAGGGPGLTFNFPAGLFRILGGQFNTGGLTFNLAGASSIVGANNVDVFGGGVFHLTGALTHSGTADLRIGGGTNLSIDVGATLSLATDAGISPLGESSLSIVGTLRKSGGNGLSQVGVAASNSGVVEVRRGTLRFGGGISEVVGSTLAGGKWQAISSSINTATLDLGTAISAIGLGAAVTLGGVNSSIPSISGLASNAGTLSLLTGANFGTNTNLSNTGTISLSSTSTLNVSGTFAQAGLGRFTVNGSGGSVGRLVTSGNVQLGGTLKVLWSGALPAIGASLTIIDNAGAGPVAGTFAGLANNAVFNVGAMTFKIRYNVGSGNNNVTLTRTA